MRCGFCFFLKDELTGRNAHAGLEQPRKVADMISGSLCHLLYRDLLVQMCFHISDGIGKGRVKALGDKGNTVWRTAFQIVMLMCDKVTHKKLIDSNLLFRKISRNLLSKMIQYNSKKIFF